MELKIWLAWNTTINSIVFAWFVNDDNERIVSMVEWVVLAIVIFSTIGIGMDFSGEEEVEMEVSNISGSIVLSTRSSMDAIGLDEYDRGAVATLDLDVSSVISEGCMDCVTPPVGIQLYGSVVITNINGDGGLGRIESTLSVVHLREFVDEGLVIREWLNLDWDAGGESVHLEMVLTHDPPRWTLDDRFHASFISVDGGEESRFGPWLFIETMLDDTVNLRGCLPDAFTCDSETVHSIDLTSTLSKIRTPVKFEHPSSWQAVSTSSDGDESPQYFEDLRQILGADSEVSTRALSCPANGEEVLAMKSWQVSVYSETAFAPLNSWYEALKLSSTTFTPSTGVWTEAEFENSGCGGFVDEQGQTTLGIFIIK